MGDQVNDLILVADDDADIVRFVEVNLRFEGFDVVSAANGEQALEAALEHQPALVLLDIMMPKLDGYEVCQRLRADSRTNHMSIIMITAKSLSADKVVGLTAGADDYIIKPFDPIELVARVRSALRRSKEMRAISPLTGLPGNLQISEEIARRVAAGLGVGVCHADLDNFKAFNDLYGFLRGDQALTYTASVLRDVARAAGPEVFLGHLGGDDFVLVCPPEMAEGVCGDITKQFDEGVISLYDPADAEKGYVELTDRRGNVVRKPLLSISIGVAIGRPGKVDDFRRLVEIATEMKAFAKRQPGSGHAVDRREPRH
jgi:diguanylate cyclase (GGDEF)-like protein